MARTTLRTACTMNCYGGCPIDVDVEDGRIVEVRGSAYFPEAGQKICLKGLSYPQLLNSPERLKTPYIRKDGVLTPASWDEAMDLIVKRLTELRDKYGPETVMLYKGSGNLGGSTANLGMNFWYCFGGYTGRSGGLCDAAQETAINDMFGSSDYGSIAEIADAKLIILWGKNPVHTNMHSMRYIHDAIDKGARLVVIDPRVSESSDRAVMHITPKGGTDGLVAAGLIKLILARGLEDRAFIEKYVHGMPEYEEYLQSLTIGSIVRETGVRLTEFSKLCDLIAETPDFALIQGKGLQRYSNGGQTCRAIAAVAAVCGIIGKRGAGFHASTFMENPPKWPFFPPKPRDHIRETVPVAAVPLEVPKLDPPVKALWVERANPMVSAPGTNDMQRFIEGMEFVVVPEAFMTETAKLADVVLPVAMFMERADLFYTYGQNYLQYRQKIVEPPEGCRSEPDIFRELAARFRFDEKYFPKNDIEILRACLAASPYGMTLEDLEVAPAKLTSYRDIAWGDLKFNTPSGKIELFSEGLAARWGCDPLPKYVPPLIPEGSFQLITPHAINRINSQFVQNFWLDDAGDDALHMNRADAARLHIKTGDTVRIYNELGELTLKVKVGERVREGAVSVFSGFANLNRLMAPIVTDIGDGASFHTAAVEIEKVIF